MGEQIMDRAAAGRFVEAWCANWRKLGDARASEFMDFDAAGRVMRSEAFYGK
jgi:hypothetical protein